MCNEFEIFWKHVSISCFHFLVVEIFFILLSVHLYRDYTPIVSYGAVCNRLVVIRFKFAPLSSLEENSF